MRRAEAEAKPTQIPGVFAITPWVMADTHIHRKLVPPLSWVGAVAASVKSVNIGELNNNLGVLSRKTLQNAAGNSTKCWLILTGAAPQTGNAGGYLCPHAQTSDKSHNKR